MNIEAKVIHVSADERRLGLSIKQIKEEEERKKPKEFRTAGPETGSNLGDLLRAKIEDAANGEDAGN